MTKPIYIVQFDKTFVDGNLAGLTVAGQTITFDTRAGGERALALYAKIATEDDFCRDAGTGAKFKLSNVKFIPSFTLPTMF